MNIVSMRTVRIDKLSDHSYVVTVSQGLVGESMTCQTEGEMVGAVLENLLPYGRGDEVYAEIGMIRSVATVSIDNLIHERLGSE